jgi:hypothetical protein
VAVNNNGGIKEEKMSVQGPMDPTCLSAYILSISSCVWAIKKVLGRSAS